MTKKLKEVFKRSANEELTKEPTIQKELSTEDLPPGITLSKGKYRVTKTFLGKNYSFGTAARLHDAKSVNKNVDAIIEFAREKNRDLINENNKLKGRNNELKIEVESLERWALKCNDRFEEVTRERDELQKELSKYKSVFNKLINRNLWQRIWNKW